MEKTHLPTSRRALLCSGATLLITTIAGCSSGSSTPGSKPDCTIENSAGDVEPVTVQADGRLSSADVTLDLRWNAQVQSSVDGDSNPPSEDLWLIMNIEVNNPSDIRVPLGDFKLTTETPGTIREDKSNGVNMIGSAEYVNRQLEEPTLKPGGETSGILFYQLGENVTTATFGVDGFGDTHYAFNPTCDDSLSIDVPL